jgi:hypothetical protein
VPRRIGTSATKGLKSKFNLVLDNSIDFKLKN